MINKNDKQLSLNLNSHEGRNKANLVTRKEEIVAVNNILSISSKIDEAKATFQAKLNASVIDRSNHLV